MSNTNQLTKMKTKIVEMEPVRLPDGMLLLSFQILNSNGARIGKVSGDLNEETATEIRARAAVEALRLGNRVSGYAPRCIGYPV